MSCERTAGRAHHVHPHLANDPGPRERLTKEMVEAGHRLSAAVPWLAAWNGTRAETRELVPR